MFLTVFRVLFTFLYFIVNVVIGDNNCICIRKYLICKNPLTAVYECGQRVCFILYSCLI